MTTTIMAETCSICAGSLKWVVVDPQKQDDTEVPEYNWGEIIWDEEQFKPKEDPFDSDNW